MKILNYFKVRNILFLSILLFGLINSLSAQSVTASNVWHFSNITVSNCGSGIWKVKAYQNYQWQVGRIHIYYGGSTLWNLGYTAGSNIGYRDCCDRPLERSGTLNTWWYAKVNTNTKRVDFYTSDWTCSSCTNASITSNPSTSSVSRCQGSSFPTLSVSASGSATLSYQWKSSTSSGGTYSNISGATSSSYTPPNNVVGTKYYKCTVTSSCNSSSATSNASGAHTVTAPPTAGTLSGTQAICVGGSTTFSSTSSGGTWSSSNTGIATINSSTGVISGVSDGTATMTYTKTGSGGCSNATATRTVTVTAIPSISSVTDGSRCNTGTVSLSASASAGAINWYAASSGGSSLGSGTSFTTPSISSTTSYYVDATSGGCTTASRTAVTATINSASTGPGGVTDELLVWLKADDASLSSTWQDHSCNGFDYSTVSGPTIVNNCWNNNPAIEILSGGFNAPSGSELGNNWAVFFVAALKESDKEGRLIDGHSGNYLLGFHNGYRNGIYWNGTPSEINNGIATLSDVTSPHIYSYVRDNSNSSIKARVDGDLLKTFYSTASGSGIRLDINQGSYSSESTDSRIGEFIIFNTKLTDTQIHKVETYLAVKYGITLSIDDGGSAGDFISSSGVTYWDASARSGYNNDVIVIGKDNNSSSIQKQSKSKDDSLIIYMSSLASSNQTNSASITNNESFIAIGHNGGQLKSNSSTNSEKPSGISSRFGREWCLTNTNFTDDFSFKVEWDSSGTFDINDIRLLVDDDGDFSNASVYGSDDGLTFSLGSIVVGGASSSIFPSGNTKYFTLASSSESTPLPIELLYFTANKEDGQTILNWETAMEINNDYFIVEKSTDGNEWEQITTISGAGISASPITYVYIDKDICENTCYYRLSQVDYDGTQEVFKHIVISKDDNNFMEMSVSPNPIINKANVSFNTPKSGYFNFSIISHNGQVVYESKLIGTEGNNSFILNTDILSNGIYSFIINDVNGNMVQQRIVK